MNKWTEMNKLINFYTHLITVDTTWNTVTNTKKDESKNQKTEKVFIISLDYNRK